MNKTFQNTRGVTEHRLNILRHRQIANCNFNCINFLYRNALHARLTSFFKVWSYKLKEKTKMKKQDANMFRKNLKIKGVSINSSHLDHLDHMSKKESILQVIIPRSSCARLLKEFVDRDILIIFMNSDRKIMQPNIMTSGPLVIIKNWKQFSQFI